MKQLILAFITLLFLSAQDNHYLNIYLEHLPKYSKDIDTDNKFLDFSAYKNLIFYGIGYRRGLNDDFMIGLDLSYNSKLLFEDEFIHTTSSSPNSGPKYKLKVRSKIFKSSLVLLYHIYHSRDIEFNFSLIPTLSFLSENNKFGPVFNDTAKASNFSVNPAFEFNYKISSFLGIYFNATYSFIKFSDIKYSSENVTAKQNNLQVSGFKDSGIRFKKGDKTDIGANRVLDQRGIYSRIGFLIRL